MEKISRNAWCGNVMVGNTLKARWTRRNELRNCSQHLLSAPRWLSLKCFSTSRKVGNNLGLAVDVTWIQWQPLPFRFRLALEISFEKKKQIWLLQREAVVPKSQEQPQTVEERERRGWAAWAICRPTLHEEQLSGQWADPLWGVWPALLLWLCWNLWRANNCCAFAAAAAAAVSVSPQVLSARLAWSWTWGYLWWGANWAVC